jgi:hypothetical protein
MKRSIFILMLMIFSAQSYPPPFSSEIRMDHPHYREPSRIQYQAGSRGVSEGNFNQEVNIISPESPAASRPFPFHNPAGCFPTKPDDLAPEVLLDNVQGQIGEDLILEDRSLKNIWSGSERSYVDISGNPYVYEFEINEYQPPFTYQVDHVVTKFVQNGFVVWLRSYGGHFRLLAVSLIPSPDTDIWADYITTYWQKGGLPEDEFIVPVSRKLPCHWMVEEGYVSNEMIQENFDLDWQIPDYLNAGRQYLAKTCSEAYRISQEKIGYWDATSMCGPLTWQILQDANSFPYRIGNYNSNGDLFIQANPRYGGRRPWTGFDPETYDLIRIKEPMTDYDFTSLGELNSGDIVFSFGSSDQWSPGNGHYSHIFLVAGVDHNHSRLAVTNMVKLYRGIKDCSISEVILYTPGDPINGTIRHEWDNHGYGSTGEHGFDLFRWKWISHHLEGTSREYTVRWGETIESIAFDWKISPDQILESNNFSDDVQLEPGQKVILPVSDQLKKGYSWSN